MRVLGELTVTAKYGSQCQEHTLIVIAENGPPLLGRNWLQQVRLDWEPLKLGTIHVSTNFTLQSVLQKHSEVFKEE